MIPLWTLLALGSAFCLATSDALTKKALQEEEADEYIVAWLRLLFSLPVLFVFLPFIKIPSLDNVFFKAFLLALPLEVITVYLYVKALKLSPLSLTLPFLSLTPLFLIFTSRVIVGEVIPKEAVAGIILIVAGGYTLNISSARIGIFEPFRAILKEKGSLLMIIVAFIYSITSSLGKVAIEHSSPLFFGITYFTALVFALTPLSLLFSKRATASPSTVTSPLTVTSPPSSVKLLVARLWKGMILPGLLYGAMIVFHMLSLDLTNVAYMISVKRLSLLIGVIYGHLFFNEKNLKERVVGTVLMLSGFVLIVNASM